LLFDEREWYLTLKGNRVSGLITYWEFNRHEFRVQLYAIVSLIEAISRDILSEDGCGVTDATCINLDPQELTDPLKRFEAAKEAGGGNRFVDELDFHQVHQIGHGDSAIALLGTPREYALSLERPEFEGSR
jgi:hypothetical protein